MRRFLVISSIFVSLALASALPVAAEETPTAAPQQPPSRVVNLVNPLDKCPPNAEADDPCRTTVPELVGNIVSTAVGVVGAFALLIFIYGGFLMLTSSGEAAKIQAGKDAMKWAVIGLIVVFSSYALVNFVLTAITKRV